MSQRDSDIKKAVLHGQAWQGTNLPLFVAFTNHLDLHSIKYSLEFGSLLGAVRQGAPTLWDDDFDIVVDDEDKNRLKALCVEYRGAGKGLPAKPKGAKYARCSFTVAGGTGFSLEFNDSGFAFVRTYVAEEKKEKILFDIWFPSTPGWPRQSSAGKFPLLRRQFGAYQLWTYNDPGLYLDELYGKEWRTTFRVYSHKINDAKAFHKENAKQYYKVKREEYDLLAIRWGA